MTRATILGGTGFIGSHVARELAANGLEVSVVHRRTVPEARRLPRIAYVQIDGSPGSIEAALRELQPEVVFNLAAAGVGDTPDRAELVRGNIGVVAEVLDASEGGDIVRIVHAGSWSQYFVNEDQPLVETDTARPRSEYGAVKLGAESLGMAGSSTLGLGFISLRLFNVYGPGEGPRRLIPYVAGQVLRGQTARLTRGHQVRDFVFVADVASAFVAALSLPPELIRCFNVSSGEGTPVREVAIAAAAAAGGHRSQLEFGAIPDRGDEPLTVIGDSSAFRSASAWRPTTGLPEGIARTVEWARGRTEHE